GVTPRTRGGLVKVRPVGTGSAVAVVAPASPFDRDEFSRGIAELERLGLTPIYDDGVFEKHGFLAGTADRRARELAAAWRRADVDAIIAVRGGYGSLETLPWLVPEDIVRSRTALVGYSDITSLHVFLNVHVGLVSIHGPMLDGRLAAGVAAYDPVSLLSCLSENPVGELTPPGVDVVRPGEARGPLVGGTLTQLVGSLGTPWPFTPPRGHILFVDEVGERPYRLHRMLTQWRLSGGFERAAGIVVGQLPQSDEPGGAYTGAGVILDVLADFPGPVLIGFPSGHTTTPLVSLPFGVETVVLAGSRPGLVVAEAAASR
ncbi:MAG TPA: LD-carboxypeptidase, partial [Vicinamibacterales bacterium]|nr:LD-carboxypeptidase [Vicinamibacterales bacterium]